jgi:ATP synthase protein I
MFKHHLAIGYKLIITQLILLSIAAGVALFISDWRGFISVLLGGGAWIIPSLYFVHKLFKPETVRDLQALSKDFLLGEGVKLLLSAVLIVFILFFVSIKTLSFLSGYVAAITASFLMPFWVSSRFGFATGQGGAKK